MTLPRRHIEIKPPGLQVVAIAIVLHAAEHIPQPPLPGSKAGEREPNVALTLVICIIHADDQAGATRILPGVGDNSIGGLVAIPGGCTFQQSPFPIADDRSPQQLSQRS